MSKHLRKINLNVSMMHRRRRHDQKPIHGLYVFSSDTVHGAPAFQKEKDPDMWLAKGITCVITVIGVKAIGVKADHVCGPNPKQSERERDDL